MYFLDSGEQSSLVFQSAAIYEENGLISEAQILLRSSHREVNVRVNSESIAEVILDRAAV